LLAHATSNGSQKNPRHNMFASQVAPSDSDVPPAAARALLPVGLRQVDRKVTPRAAAGLTSVTMDAALVVGPIAPATKQARTGSGRHDLAGRAGRPRPAVLPRPGFHAVIGHRIVLELNVCFDDVRAGLQVLAMGWPTIWGWVKLSRSLLPLRSRARA